MTLALALLVLAALSALVCRFMIRARILDVPGARSSHGSPVPKGGGIGIAAAFAAGTAASAWLLPDPYPSLWLLAAGVLIAGFSWIDDVRPLGFAPKLGLQVACGLLLVHGGFVLDHVGPVKLGFAGVPLTLAWLVVAANAVNFIDGLNGLAAGTVLIVAIAAASLGSAGLLVAGAMVAGTLSLGAGIVGFLPFNFPRARLFMGDAGSQLCGLVAGAAATTLSATADPWGVLVVPLGLAAVLADVAFTLVRRARAGDRLTEAHRGHLYQLAQRSGVDATIIALVYWGFCLWGCILGVMAIDEGWQGAAVAVGLTLAPFALWAYLVLAMARRASIGRW